MYDTGFYDEPFYDSQFSCSHVWGFSPVSVSLYGALALTTIGFSVQDLALIKVQAKEMGIGYQNLIQTLVHNYVTGKIKLGI